MGTEGTAHRNATLADFAAPLSVPRPLPVVGLITDTDYAREISELREISTVLSMIRARTRAS